MEYTVKALAELSGVTPRTLRWYDRMGLLKPDRLTQAGYRLYGPAEVDRLQQILFYRELEVPLADISAMLDDPNFDRQLALEGHLRALRDRRARLDNLILTVQQTLKEAKGEITMQDEEKFRVFQKEAVEANEARYGNEARDRYGDAAVNDFNAAFLSMDREEHHAWEVLGAEINAALAAAVRAEEDPAGAEGQRIAALHARWLCFGGQKYDPARHAGIAELYPADERFTAYYDEKVTGCAVFLRNAVRVYTKC